ncbi:MAG TPA: MXAN_2562 family outer membrane beta-barrel protein [Kofleriaceae bacterium]|nr:MXAN_2562 family outer membrane beta-barrel protein [Kofleriaceae bacterium]
MSRWTTRLSLLLTSAAWPAVASAQGTPSPPPPPIDLGGGSIQMEMQLPDGDGGFRPENEQDVRRHFNRANCLCTDAQFGVKFTLVNAPTSVDSEPVDVWFGTMCDTADPTIRDANCEKVHTFGDVEELRSPRTVGFGVGELAAGDCSPNESERNIYALIDLNDDGIDTSQGDYVGGPLGQLLDTQAPPMPDDLEALGIEGGVRVSWDLPESRVEDIEFFNLLCAREDGSESEDDDLPRDVDLHYFTSADACGLEDPTVCPRPLASARALPGGGDAGPAPDAGEPEAECSVLPGALSTLDAAHLCGEAGASSTSISATGLEIGVEYRVVLVVVDHSRNPLAIDMGVVKPGQARDFWEEYHEQGGTAKGGCSVGGAESIGWIALAFGVLSAGFAFGGPRVRRRRRRAGTAVLLLLLGGGAARAQPWYEAVGEPVQAEEGPSQIHWGLEFKFAPYVPDVDSEFNLSGDEVGPFERMYGDGPFLMSQVVVDRYFVHPGGQLGIYGTLGYLTRTVNAFMLDEGGNLVPKENGDPRRSPGNETRFRLIPMSVGAVYRWTQLDDIYRVPLVPYGRIGLSYYYWSVTKPGGSIAEVPTSDCPDLDGCEGDRARGGSWGWQGTLGLALRAERIDPDAEVALRTELGIEHAGFLAELTYAKVDGFGSDDKLSVGDLTWFGGINFEF